MKENNTLETAIMAAGCPKSFMTKIVVDYNKKNSYKSSATNSRNKIWEFKAGKPNAKSPATIIAKHCAMFAGLVKDSITGILPDSCYPIKISDANKGMILENNRIWVEIDKDGKVLSFVEETSTKAEDDIVEVETVTNALPSPKEDELDDEFDLN